MNNNNRVYRKCMGEFIDVFWYSGIILKENYGNSCERKEKGLYFHGKKCYEKNTPTQLKQQ